MEQPKWFWDPSIAPSGLAYYDGDQFPKWREIFSWARSSAMLVRQNWMAPNSLRREAFKKQRRPYPKRPPGPDGIFIFSPTLREAP